jgi:ribonuclease J
VVTARDAPIHTSGHAHREELKLMLGLTRPRYLLPVHGDHKRIRLHGELAQTLGIDPDRIFAADNGIALDIGPDGATLGTPEQAGMIFVDGIELGDPAESALRDRRDLAHDGVVFVVSTLSAQDSETLAPHEIVIRGVPLAEDEATFRDALRDEIEAARDRAVDHDVHDPAALEQALHDHLAQFILDRARPRPMILPVVVEV